MKKTPADVLDFYDMEVATMICEKYGIKQMEALRRFLASETYVMLADAKLQMWQFGPPAIFDMWESEQITGDPRNSLYLRGDDVV